MYNVNASARHTSYYENDLTVPYLVSVKPFSYCINKAKSLDFNMDDIDEIY